MDLLPPPHPPRRVTVVNPSDGGMVHWLLKFYAFGALSLYFFYRAARILL